MGPLSSILPLRANLGKGDACFKAEEDRISLSLSVGLWQTPEAGRPSSPQRLLSLFRSTQTHLPAEPGCCIPTTPAVPLATTPSCCQKVFLAALFI